VEHPNSSGGHTGPPLQNYSPFARLSSGGVTPPFIQGAGEIPGTHSVTRIISVRAKLRFRPGSQERIHQFANPTGANTEIRPYDIHSILAFLSSRQSRNARTMLRKGRKQRLSRRQFEVSEIKSRGDRTADQGKRIRINNLGAEKTPLRNGCLEPFAGIDIRPERHCAIRPVGKKHMDRKRAARVKMPQLILFDAMKGRELAAL